MLEHFFNFVHTMLRQTTFRVFYFFLCGQNGYVWIPSEFWLKELSTKIEFTNNTLTKSWVIHFYLSSNEKIMCLSGDKFCVT